MIAEAFARSLENPSTSLADPAEWLYDALGAGKSASGVNVSQKAALGYSPVWRAVSLISGDVAKLPQFIYRREGDGKVRAPEHPAYRMLRYKPCPEMTAFVFKRRLQCQAILRGNGYAYIQRRGDGAPLELWPLDAATTYPVRVNGALWYVTGAGGDESKLPARDVLHIRGPGDGLEGWSLIRYARESLGLGIAARKYGAVFFANNARPSFVLEHPGVLGAEAQTNLRRSWVEMHAGLDEAHKPAILEEGMKINAYSTSNEDAQFLQTRQFEIREVANWTGVPPHKLGDTTRTAFASLEQENQSYLNDAVDPWLTVWDTECWDKLLTEPQKARDTHVIEHMRQALVRADIKARGAYYRMALGGAPWMTRNEVRGLENLNPSDDPAASEFLDPLNMTGATQEPAAEPEPEPEADESERQEAVRQAIGEAVQADISRMCRRLEAASGRKGFAAADHSAVVREAIAPSLTAARAAGLTQATPQDVADAMCAREAWPETAAAEIVARLLEEPN